MNPEKDEILEFFEWKSKLHKLIDKKVIWLTKKDSTVLDLKNFLRLFNIESLQNTWKVEENRCGDSLMETWVEKSREVARVQEELKELKKRQEKKMEVIANRWKKVERGQI